MTHRTERCDHGFDREQSLCRWCPVVRRAQEPRPVEPEFRHPRPDIEVVAIVSVVGELSVGEEFRIARERRKGRAA